MSTSTANRIWQESIEQALLTGDVTESAAEAIRTEHQRRAAAHAQQRNSRRIIELLGYAGGLLAIIGGSVVASSLLADDSGLWAVVMLALTICLTTATGIVAATTVGGFRAVRTLPARRRATGTLAVAAGICAAATVWMLAEGSGSTSDQAWATAGFAVLLLVAIAATWLAPGAVPTLAVIGSAAGVLFSWADWAGWQQPEWAFGVLLVGYSAAVGLLLSWLLVPRVLVEALAVAGWLFGANILFWSSNTVVVTSDKVEVQTTDIATQLGRFAFAMVILVGLVRYLRGGNWPWAVAVVIAPAMWLMQDFDDELGTGVATLAAGLLLAGASVVLALLRRRTQRTQSAPLSDDVPPSESQADHSVSQ